MGKKYFLIMFYLILIPRLLYAYLDPGTGSYILQVIIAALLGVAFTIKIYWKKLKSFFSSLFSKRTGKDNEQ